MGRARSPTWLIQATGGLTDREMSEQVLDNMDIERERGITIKAQTVRLTYQAPRRPDLRAQPDGHPGHVDFAYEVSAQPRRLRGALLVVDAAQGVEAQTLANVYQSIEHDHEIVPVDQQDRPPRRRAREGPPRDRGRDRPRRQRGRAHLAPSRASASRTCSRRSSPRSSPPKGDRAARSKAMLVDAWYDPYLGVGHPRRGHRRRHQEGPDRSSSCRAAPST